MSNLTPKIQCQNNFHRLRLLNGNLFHAENAHFKFSSSFNVLIKFTKQFFSRITSSSTTQNNSPNEELNVLFNAFAFPLLLPFSISETFILLVSDSFIKFSTILMVSSVQWSMQITISFSTETGISFRFSATELSVLYIVNTPLCVGTAMVSDFILIRLS